MRMFPNAARAIVLVIVGGLTCGAQAADEPAPEPTAFEWAYSVDLQAVWIANSNVYFGESQAVLGADIDDWSEYGIEPGISFQAPWRGGTAFGALSVIATTTVGNDASGLTLGIQDQSEANLEQANLGWRARDLFDAFEGETFTVTAGSLDYTIGSGLLITDGGSDGAEHGGWNLGMRKSFSQSLLVELQTETLKLEAFRLANRPRRGGPQGTALGVNAEWSFRADYTVGGTAMSVDTNTNTGDALTVLSGRFDRAPEAGLGFSAELVGEHSDQIEATGGFWKLSYAASEMPWTPTVSYRYAAFSGDDPLTATDERFREVAYGYTDYGTWFQGEITGSYPLGNGNTTSHLFRLELAPSDALLLNVLYYRFAFDESPAPGVTSDDWGDELDLIVDWAWDDRLSFVGVLGVLAPGDAAVQLAGGDEDWVLGALYASFSW